MAVKLAKEAIDGGIQMNLENGLAVEEKIYTSVIDSEDRKEALNAFVEKRKPVFKGK